MIRVRIADPRGREVTQLVRHIGGVPITLHVVFTDFQQRTERSELVAIDIEGTLERDWDINGNEDGSLEDEERPPGE